MRTAAATNETALDRSASSPLLRVEDLTIEFPTERGWVPVVDRVSFDVLEDEVVALIGESGCGKSVTSQAILGLTGHAGGRVVGGRVVFDGNDVLTMNRSQIRQLRAASIAMVFQEPMSCLDPAFTIGQQITGVLRRHRGLSRKQARNEAIELLDRVGIPDATHRFDEYPHTLSGGMRQRALIAQALSCGPRLLIADEPTTALDVTVQAQVLDLLAELRSDFGMSVLFVTHDLGVIAEISHRVLVMYAGQVVEEGSSMTIFTHPQHPYTSALLGCLPEVRPAEPLTALPGSVPPPHASPAGCRFEPRCDHATADCAAPQEIVAIDDARRARCVRASALDLPGVES